VLEVAALARTLARGLALDESLAEAIALAHDLGHPPFGHVGERALAHLAGHFHHAAHGVRVVEQLEPLDLPPEVRAGILLHSKGKGPILAPRAHAELPHATPEAAVVRVADLIAYASHDTDDALALGYLEPSALPSDTRAFLAAHGGEGFLPAQIARAFVRDVLAHSSPATAEPSAAPAVVAMSAAGEAALDALRAALYERFYERAELLAFVPTIRDVLAAAYEDALRALPPREALDRVAALTDRAALTAHDALLRTRRRPAGASRPARSSLSHLAPSAPVRAVHPVA
jgi:dGTPase